MELQLGLREDVWVAFFTLRGVAVVDGRFTLPAGSPAFLPQSLAFLPVELGPEPPEDLATVFQG